MSSTIAWALVALLKPLGERSHSGGLSHTRGSSSARLPSIARHGDWVAGDRAINDDPERLRARAVQQFAMVLLDIEQEYADKLVAEAVELQERAAVIEEVYRLSASP